MGSYPETIKQNTTAGGLEVKHVISVPTSVLVTIFVGTLLITLFKYFTK